MNKIRTDFLKGLGITSPCPSDYDYLEPITDYQLLKVLDKQARKNGVEPGIMKVRYGLRKHTIPNLRYHEARKNKILK